MLRRFIIFLLANVSAGLAAAASSPSAAPLPAVWDPADFGAKIDGVANDRAALQRAIDRAAAGGGGIVKIQAGHALLTGSFELKSNVTLQIDAGARIIASRRQEDYDEPCLLRARHANHIAITGRGTIDGQGEAFFTETRPPIYRPMKWRPRLVVLEDCREVLVSEVTLQDSASWTLHLAGCVNVAVRGIAIRNPLQAPNCDGIDPDHSRNVLISGCSIVCGDDAIVVKSSREFSQYGPTENIVVTGCVLTTQDCALKVGTETVGPIRNVVFADCVVEDCQRGIGIIVRDEGDVENIDAHDIIIRSHLFYQAWWGGSEAIAVVVRPRHPGGKMGRVEHLRFSHISSTGEAGVFIQGSEASQPEDVALEDVSLVIEKSTAWPSRVDLRPGTDLGEFGLEEKGVIIAGYHLRDARRVSLQNCSVRWAPHAPASYGPALRVERVADFENLRFHGADAVPDAR